MRFTITPVLFNVGVNEMATIAEKLGNTGPQNKNNSDNFRKEAIFHLLSITLPIFYEKDLSHFGRYSYLSHQNTFCP